MKYKQIELDNNFYTDDYYQIEKLDDSLTQILVNRGINDITNWLIRRNESNINSPWAFNKVSVNIVIELLKIAIQNKKHICVIVDVDADGYISSAIILNYLYDLYLLGDTLTIDEIKERLTYIYNDRKQHGLEDCYNKIADNIELVIIPDVGTNDITQMKYLSDKNIQVIRMHYHESEVI